MNAARPGTILTVLAAVAGVLAAPAALGREMPAEPQEARSTAPGYEEFVASSRDYEVIRRPEWGYDENRFWLQAQAELLSEDPADYADGVWVRAWLDADADGVFEDTERILSTVRFPRRGQKRIGFEGSLDLGEDAAIPERTYLRLVLAYGGPAGPAGRADFGDVKDFAVTDGEMGGSDEGRDVTVVPPAHPPVVVPGGQVTTTFLIVENSPGALSGSFVFVSPKGTAVALGNPNTRAERKRGDIRIGRLRGRGRSTILHIDRKSTVASVIEITLVIDVEPGFLGALDIKTNIDGVSIRVAVESSGGDPTDPGVGVGATQDPLPVVSAGENGQQVSPIRIRERKAGGLRPGRVQLVSPKGTAVALRNGHGVVVKQGDIRIGNVRVRGRTIEFDVLGESTEPSEIVVTVDLDVQPSFTDPSVQMENNIEGAVTEGGEDPGMLTTVATAG